MVVIENIHASGGEVAGVVGVEGRKHTLRFASEQVDLQPSPEAFLLLAMPAAMRIGQPVQMAESVSGSLLSRLPEIQALYLRWVPGLKAVEVHANASEDRVSGERPGALFFTGGVDSFFSALQAPASTLVFVHGLDISLQRQRLRKTISSKLRAAATGSGHPFLELESNLRELTNPYLPWQYAFGFALAACGFLLSGSFSSFGIAGSYSEAGETLLGRASSDGSHPDLVPLFSCGGIRFHTVGMQARRIEKLEALATSPPAREALRVCWENPGNSYNCCRCEKCLRTMAALAALGRLEDFGCFDQVLDYRKLARIASKGTATEVFVHENLQIARQRGADPVLISSLESSLLKRPSLTSRLANNRVSRRLRHWMRLVAMPARQGFRRGPDS